MGEEIHGRDRGGPADFRIGEHIELQVADVSGKDLQLFESAIHALHLFAILRRGFRIVRAWRSLREWHGAEIDAQVQVVADFAKIAGEHGGEDIAFGDGIILAAFLACAHGLLHLFRGFGRNIGLVELGNDAVDHTDARGGVDLEIDVARHQGARRNGADCEVSYLSGIVFHGQRADGLRVAVVFLDEKFDPERFALFDGEKFKSAGGVAERHHVIGGVVGLIFLVKGVELRVLAAVECFEPGFEGLAGGSYYYEAGAWDACEDEEA